MLSTFPLNGHLVTCLSLALGFEEDFFTKAMDVNAKDNQTQLRMIHYMASENATGTWRAGAHTDIGCLTLLFQRDGEDGLEVLPGRENHRSKIGGGQFSPIPAKTGPIVVNIGDMMSICKSHRMKLTGSQLTSLRSGLVR
jgi:isopenicillin N synthase-like dioxygenase